jgi:glycosyltransferase involved in cell wall biosynthesis
MGTERFSLVIPVFNNDESLEELFAKIEKEIYDYDLSDKVEIVFVEDGSTDNSLELITSFKDRSELLIKVVKLDSNYGQTYAIKVGFSLATGEAVMTISADLQDPVFLISSFYLAYQSGHNIIVGIRAQRNDGIYRKITSSIAYKIARLRSRRLPLGGFDCYMVSKQIILNIILEHPTSQFLQGHISGINTIHTQIEYIRENRLHGKSQWTFWKKFLLLWSILFYNSFVSPIKFLKYFLILFSMFFYLLCQLVLIFYLNFSIMLIILLFSLLFLFQAKLIHSSFNEIEYKHRFDDSFHSRYEII